MRAFGTLRIVFVVAIIFLSLAECRPNKENYPDDAEYDEDSTLGADDDEPTDTQHDPAPQFRSRPLTLEVRPGATVELPCIVDNAEDTVIVWMKAKEYLYTDDRLMTDRYARLIRSDNYSLIIPNVTEQDASDQYRCQVLIEPNPLELVHRLRVVEEPRELWNDMPLIHVTPGRRVEVNESESVTLGCEPRLQPKPEIKWSHKGERLHNGEEIESGGNFIKIKKATRHHSGRYQCLAENGSEKPPHDSIEVIVRYKPEIEVEHEMVHTGPGMKSELTCIVHAHPHAKIVWHKNKKPVVEKKDRKSMIEDKSRRTLIIEHTTIHDLGQYTCTAKNQLGETSRTIELTGAPAKPRFHSGEVADDESTLILKWHVESFAPIVEYRLDYRRKGETSWTTVSPRVTNGRGNQFTAEHPLERLQPGSYEAIMMARNEYGWSQRSNVHTFREEYKSDEPENVKGSAFTSRPVLALTTLLLVAVSSYESMCL